MQCEYVVRTAGERTEELCLNFIRRQKEEKESITVLREPTHAGAVEQTILCGMHCGADWLVAVDADVLFLPGGLSSIRQEIQSREDSPAVVYPAVFDKQWGMFRWAGIQVYNIAIIELVYELFQEARKHHKLKVEGATISLLRKQGKEVFFSRSPVALHDFHQYYRDLFRKVYLNTIRNSGMNEKARKYWQTHKNKDDDYRVMICAQQDALIENKQLTNSVRDFHADDLMRRIHSLGLEEKKPLTADECSQWAGEHCLRSEMEQIGGNRYVNDYFDNPGTMDKLSGLLKRRAPTFTSGAKKIVDFIRN